MLECKICHKLKNEEEFGKDNSNKTGYKHICKQCEKHKYRKICPVCNKEFNTANSAQICCSRTCAGIKNRKRVETTCDICGKAIIISQSRYERSIHHYCSVECMGKGESKFHVGETGKNFKGHSITYNCEICGKEATKCIAEYKKYKHHYCSLTCKLKGQTVFGSGINSPKYDPSLTANERDRYRNLVNYNNWRKQVYSRDNYTCQCCKKPNSGKIVAHHLDGFKENVELRTNPTNGIALCEQCHMKFHSKYGRGNNTRGQFIEFAKKYYGIEEKDLFKNESKQFINICVVCGKGFETTVLSQKTCSLECKRILLGHSVRCSCDVCGKEIIIGKAKYQKQEHHFCSNRCRHIGLRIFYVRQKEERKNKVTVTCDYCDKEFEISPYRLTATKHHYCSRECADKGYSKYIEENHPATSLKEVPCDICGKTILLPPSRMRSKHHYCSRECQFEGQRRFKNGKI